MWEKPKNRDATEVEELYCLMLIPPVVNDSDRGVTDEPIARWIKVDDIAGKESLHRPISSLLKQRYEIEAFRCCFPGHSTHHFLIRQSPCRLRQELTLIGPDDQNRFAIVGTAIGNHGSQILCEVVQADAWRP